MTALSFLMQEASNFHRISLLETVGKSVYLDINAVSHTQPLFWYCLDEKGYSNKSHFLETPGLPLELVISDQELTCISEEALEVALYLPDKQYQVMQAILISTPAKELALSNPLLFILLVLKAEKQNLSEESFKILVRKKRTQLLAYLDLPTQPSVVRLLNRTALNFKSLKDLEVLSTVLRNTKILPLIQHVKQPCIQHFLFINSYTDKLTTNLLNLITPATTSEEIEHILRTTRDCFRLGMQQNQLNPVSNLAELNSLHDRLILRYNESNFLEQRYLYEYGLFPPPPLPGNEVIVPLKSWSDLILEGKKMRHCVASYHWYLAKREVFIYQANASQRLTVSLALKDKQWVLEEIRGIGNAEPTKEDLELVYQWYLAATGQDQATEAS